MSHAIRTQVALLWQFLSLFHKPFMRNLHIVVAALVVLQLLSGEGMEMSALRGSRHVWERLVSWYHIFGGLFAVAGVACLSAAAVSRRGLRHFYPYCWGTTQKLREDLGSILRLRMIVPRPEGLRAVWHGVGLFALLGASVTGLLWFLFWLSSIRGRHGFLDAHEAFAWLVTIYVLGHSAIALIHFVSWERKQSQKRSAA